MDNEPSMRRLRIAAQQYVYAVSKLPYPAAFDFIHTQFARLVAHDFHIEQMAWLNPYELASVANYIAIYGSTSPKQRPLSNVAESLNALKTLWKLAEDEGDYSDDPAYEATFAMRWVYQQMPFSIHPLRVARVMSLMRSLLSFSEVESYVRNKLGLSGERLVASCVPLLNSFLKRSRYDEGDLLRTGASEDVRTVLDLIAANRPARRAFFNGKLKVKSPVEVPYELNTLLRFPIIKHESVYYAPYPELIGYAVTRGLFFRFCEEDGDVFRKPFVRSYEADTASILASMLPSAEVLTEQDERRLGWKGKTNDVTAIWADCALLIECKLSGLFVEAKRTASPEVIIADVRKQIADGQSRRGLFQLYDKCEAIRSKTLPAALMEKYANVKRFFPVLLLFDAVNFANAAETIGNIIKDELGAYGVRDFQYQIWHLEELSWLAECGGDEAMAWVVEKFSPLSETVDLNTFVANRSGREYLRPAMYMPEGDTRAYRILKRLSTKYIA